MMHTTMHYLYYNKGDETTMRTRTLGIRLSESEYVDIDRICDELHTTKAAFIRYAIFNLVSEIKHGHGYYE